MSYKLLDFGLQAGLLHQSLILLEDYAARTDDNICPVTFKKSNDDKGERQC